MATWDIDVLGAQNVLLNTAKIAQNYNTIGTSFQDMYGQIPGIIHSDNPILDELWLVFQSSLQPNFAGIITTTASVFEKTSSAIDFYQNADYVMAGDLQTSQKDMSIYEDLQRAKTQSYPMHGRRSLLP